MGECLYPHTPDDQALSTPPVRQRPGHQLAERPDKRISRLDHSDVGYRHAMRRKEQGENSPGHSVVQVVDEPCLTNAEESAVTPTGKGKDGPKRRSLGVGMQNAVASRFCPMPDMLTCLANQGAKQESGDSVADPQIE